MRARQVDRLLNLLERGEPVSRVLIENTLGCLRAASRVSELRKEGFDIRTGLQAVGRGRHVATYQLIQQAPIAPDGQGQLFPTAGERA